MIALGAIIAAEIVLTLADFVVEIAARKVAAQTAPTNALLLENLLATVPARPEPARTVIFFSNGSFDGIIGGFVRARTP